MRLKSWPLFNFFLYVDWWVFEGEFYFRLTSLLYELDMIVAFLDVLLYISNLERVRCMFPLTKNQLPLSNFVFGLSHQETLCPQIVFYLLDCVLGAVKLLRDLARRRRRTSVKDIPYQLLKQHLSMSAQRLAQNVQGCQHHLTK